MSVQRTESNANDNAARDVDAARQRPTDKPREEPKTELVDRFRTLMQSRSEGKDPRMELRQQGREAGEVATHAGASEADAAQLATDNAIKRKGHEGDQGGDGTGTGEAMKPAELAALMQAQVLTQHAPTAMPTAAPQAHANPQALADMLERHVRQLAVGGDGSRAENGQVLLRLNDATLPGTDLLLSRTETGWLLRADVRSRGSFDAIQQAAPQLAERFAARNLGELQVDAHYAG